MKKTILILFVLGFIVSFFVGVYFWGTEINTFNYQLKISPNFSLLDIAFLNSNEEIYKSHIISTLIYLFFVLSIISYKKNSSALILFGLILFQLLYDFFCIYKIYIGEYQGQHFRIDFLIFIYGLIVWRKLTILHKQK